MIGEGFRRALIYLLLFTLIFGTIKGITTGVYWGKEYKNIMETIINKLPDFYVKNGELIVDSNKPITLHQSRNSIYIVDTTGVIGTEYLDSFENGVLFLKESLLLKSNFEIFELKYNNLDIEGFNKSTLYNILPIKTVGIIIGLLTVFIFFLEKLLTSLVTTIFLRLVMTFVKGKIPFNNLIVVAIYALTIPSIIKLTFDLFGLGFTWFLYYIIYIIYVLLAVKQVWKTNIR